MTRSDWCHYFRLELQKLAQSDCGSNSCMFAGRGKGGMRTNGSCQCYQNKAYEFAGKIELVDDVNPCDATESDIY